MEEKKIKGKPVIKITEVQLKHIVQCIVEIKDKAPEKNKVVISGEGWRNTFVIFLDKPVAIEGS